MPNAYTYLIVRKADRKRYIGFRSANVPRGIPARDDLGRTYFTSSDVVRPEFERNPSAFMFRVLQEFNSKDEAAEAESKLFAKYNTTASDQYLNKCDWLHGKFAPDRSKPVLAWKDGEIVGFYKSASVAAWELGANDPSSITNCLRKATNSKGYPCKKAQGFQWTYAEEYEEGHDSGESVEHELLADCEGLTDEGPEAAYIDKEATEIRAALNRSMLESMTDKQRTAFTLVRVEGKTLHEARDIMGFKFHNSVVNHLKNADKKIKEALAATDK